jgi:hypothetical protein
MTYGLGTENQNLPAFVVMHESAPARRRPDLVGRIPAQDPSRPSRSMRSATGSSTTSPGTMVQSEAQQRSSLDLLKEMNQRHLEVRAPQGDLAARINSFELAYRMQMSAPEAIELAHETDATKKLYGLDNKTCEVFARQCLTARRLVERGVRFVQIFAGKNAGGDGAVDDVPWDGHNNIETNHRCLRCRHRSTRRRPHR